MTSNHDSVTQGCCNLVGAIIFAACHPPSATVGRGSNSKDNAWERNRVRKINIKWAFDSRLLTHYCDVMHMDREKIKQAILNYNDYQAYVKYPKIT